MSEKIIGILGGMGPEATIDFFTRIVRGTKVKTDQDHLRILIDNNPKIPDRTLAIQGKGPSPLALLIKSAKTLERAGADFIAIPCVTAHHFYDPLQAKIKVPILHIVEETVDYVRIHLKRVHRIGLLATTGTLRSGLFQKGFSHAKVEIILPDPDIQKTRVMAAVYGKGGIKERGPTEKSKRLILDASRKLIDQGARAVVAGCTEIPLVLKDGDLSVPVVDSVEILARAAVNMAQGR